MSYTVCSAHTKHALEIHPNIAVFRHPDHAPSGQVLSSSIVSGLHNFSLKTLDIAKLPSDGFKALSGLNDDVILYWAHHEKLCLVDGELAFMGGLDLCFGRWDTHSHPISDAHPNDLDNILFPGQDFNNARVYDFQNVTKYDENKLDRTKSSRMGWSDLSLCLRGPVVQDLRAHFVQRWNFIYDEKYDVRKDKRYTLLSMGDSEDATAMYHSDGQRRHNNAAEEKTDETADPSEGHHRHLPGGAGSIYDSLRENINSGVGKAKALGNFQNQPLYPGGMSVQLTRSASRWSHGVSIEVIS